MLYASPLFLLREKCREDLFGALGRLAEIGFDGVEFLSFFGHAGAEVGARLRELGLRAVGDHVPFGRLRESPERVMEEMAAAGCGYLTVAELPWEDFAGVPDRLCALAERAKDYGLRLLFHNHDTELTETLEGEPRLRALLRRVPPEALCLEPDLGWMEIAGADCREYLRDFRDRCPVLHLKDYFRAPGFGAGKAAAVFRPTGYGVMNYPLLWPLVRGCAPEWAVLDHDGTPGRDEYEDLRLSLAFVQTLQGL